MMMAPESLSALSHVNVSVDVVYVGLCVCAGLSNSPNGARQNSTN